VAAQDTVAGFVGLGTMGSALSAHLLAAGWRVAGYDIDPARLAAHTGRGGPGVTTAVFAKDLEIIAGFAKGTGTPTPLFALASTFYAAALAQGHADDDTACVHAVLRGLAGG
jgi:3-hydroxyisobutyrate dehydrogenase-like beta-hydroxyacid dehydrogenase